MRNIKRCTTKLFAKKEKYKKVELQVCASNDAARNLYDRFGFAEKTINMEKTAFL